MKKAIVLIGMIVIIGCGDEKGKQEILGEARLSLLSDCEEMEAMLRDVYEKYSHYWGGNVLLSDYGTGDEMVGGKPEGEREYSTTNIQEKGVDEADFVKTDGEFIYLLSSDRFVIVKAYPVEEFSTSVTLPVEGWPLEMFINGDRALIFSSTYFQNGFPEGFTSDEIFPHYSPITKITVLDITSRQSPEVEYELYIDGFYITSRMVKDTVYMIGSYFLEIWDKDDIKTERILPRYYLKGKEKKVGNLCECNEFYRPPEAYDLSTLYVLSINLSKPLTTPSATAVVGSWGEVYASKNSIYIASPKNYFYFAGPVLETLSPVSTSDEETFIHKFDIGSNPEKAIYKASGKVRGRVLNQFSMDEEGEYFRIATTEGWGDEAANYLFVMEEEANSLKQIGSIEGIAPGENIYSARFIGDKGFIVTFRRVDPLFTVDLREPQNPRIVGELEVPGFSTYIHPMDDNHLITLGVDMETGWNLQLQMFDVSELDAPKLMFKEVIEGWSEAEWNHKAFTYYPPKNLLVVPVLRYDWNGNGFSGFLSYKVTIKDGFSKLGEIDHTPTEKVCVKYYDEEYCYYPYNNPRRSIVIEDYLYTISELFLKVNEIGSAQSIKTIDLPSYYPYYILY
jgi:uncharacterized secreted protein with C-terminal beta-propeller domain